jgi:hypothetical protein
VSGRPNGQAQREESSRHFSTRRWTIEPGCGVNCVGSEWTDTLALVCAGDIDVTAAGIRRRFTTGSILTTARLASPISIINAGAADAVVVTIMRARTVDAHIPPARAPKSDLLARFLSDAVAVTTIDCATPSASHDTKGPTMSNDDNGFPIAERNPDLEALDRLIGTWDVSGGAVGTASYEWMDGQYFLLQRVELEQFGQRIDGLEIIGHNQDFGADPDPDIRSCFYDNAGNTMRYVYELDGDTLTIWGGEKGSPAYYRGTFSPDGNVVSGDWVYPDGGGYTSTMTRTAS